MWANKGQETISERPDEEDCESSDKNESIEKNRHSKKRSQTRIDKILEFHKNNKSDTNTIINSGKKKLLANKIDNNNQKLSEMVAFSERKSSNSLFKNEKGMLQNYYLDSEKSTKEQTTDSNIFNNHKVYYLFLKSQANERSASYKFFNGNINNDNPDPDDEFPEIEIRLEETKDMKILNNIDKFNSAGAGRQKNYLSNNNSIGISEEEKFVSIKSVTNSEKMR